MGYGLVPKEIKKQSRFCKVSTLSSNFGKVVRTAKAFKHQFPYSFPFYKSVVHKLSIKVKLVGMRWDH